jgi:hypothetical protein
MPNDTIDWRALPAGHELDLLVAERVMGWTWVETRVAGTNERARVFAAPGATTDDGTWTRADVRRNRNAPNARYSTDIAAAWKVVGEMERRGFHARLKTPFDPKSDKVAVEHHAGFTPHGMTGWNGLPDHRGFADTMPLAICRAALAAVEG